MDNTLKRVIESMIVSDQYLDREEEALFWQAVERLGQDPTEAEALLKSVIEERSAIRESILFEELKVYLEGPLRDQLLDFEEEKRSIQWLLQFDQIPTGLRESLLFEACEALGAHIASQLIDELLETFKSNFNMPHWDLKNREDAIQWATQRWIGLSSEQIHEIMDSFLD